MKEKLQRFMQAFRMNGVVKKRTLAIGGIALVVILAIILLICLTSCKSNDPVQPDAKPENTDVQKKEDEEKEPIVVPEDMEATMDKYPDVYAWLEIPGTSAVLGTSADVSYPVAQHPTDRSFYLNHDLDGNHYQPGVMFSEATVEDRVANSKDFNDPVTIIYGHNQANRTMLGGIQTYINKMEFNEDQVIYVYQKDRRLTYQIVGGMMYESAHILYYHDFANTQPSTTKPGLTQGEEVFDTFFQLLWSGNYADTHVDKDNMPVHGDRVLILLTCDNDTSNDNYRYLVIAKLVEDTNETAEKEAK